MKQTKMRLLDGDVGEESTSLSSKSQATDGATFLTFNKKIPWEPTEYNQTKFSRMQEHYSPLG